MKDKEAAAAKGLTPGMATTNKGQTSITSYTTQGALVKSTSLRPKDQTSLIKKAWVMGMTPQGQRGDQDEEMEEENLRSNDENEEDQEMGHTGSPLEGRNLNNTSFTSTNATAQDPVPSPILTNKCMVSRWFGSLIIREGIEQHIQANGGTLKKSVSRKVDFVLVGDRPGKLKITSGRKLGIHMVGLPSLHRLLDGKVDWELFLLEPSPSIINFYEGRWGDRQETAEDNRNLKGPPEVRRMADRSDKAGTLEGTGEMGRVQFNPIMMKKRTRDLVVVPDSKSPQDKMGGLVEGSVLINRRGEPPCSLGH
jgi:hypothetical protein